MQPLQDYTRQASAQVKSLLAQNNLPTDLQLHRYMRELVRHLNSLTASAPPGLRREVERPFDGLWDFSQNTPLWSTPLRVDHLIYVLKHLEVLLLAGREVMGEVAIREINHDVRHLLHTTPFSRIQRDLVRREGGLLVRGVRVQLTLDLAPDGTHHICAWEFRHGEREVRESVLYWDENFDYGPSSEEDPSSEEEAMSEDKAEGGQDQAPAEAGPGAAGAAPAPSPWSAKRGRGRRRQDEVASAEAGPVAAEAAAAPPPLSAKRGRGLRLQECGRAAGKGRGRGAQGRGRAARRTL